MSKSAGEEGVVQMIEVDSFGHQPMTEEDTGTNDKNGKESDRNIDLNSAGGHCHIDVEVPGAAARPSATASVFFSYSSKDAEWVEEAAAKLETEHGISCIYDDRDFIAGKSIIDNILSCTRICKSIILVLSPDFLNSGWCEYEAQLALTEHMTKERKTVIPVLLKECTIPDFISHLTYLDVKDHNFWDKLLAIHTLDFDHSNSSRISPHGLFSFSETDNFNGKALFGQVQNGKCGLGDFDFDAIHEKLIATGIQIDRCIIERVKESLQGNGYLGCISCHSVITSLSCSVISVLFLLALTMTSIMFAILDISYTIELAGYRKQYFEGLLIMSLIILCALCWIVYCGCLAQMPVLIFAAERAANSILINYNVIMGVVPRSRINGKRCMLFVYFRAQSCIESTEKLLLYQLQKHIVKRLTSDAVDEESLLPDDSHMSSPVDDEGIEILDKIKTLARKRIAATASSYVQQIAMESLPSSPMGQRHSPKGVCLCQLLEWEG